MVTSVVCCVFEFDSFSLGSLNIPSSPFVSLSSSLSAWIGSFSFVYLIFSLTRLFTLSNLLPSFLFQFEVISTNCYQEHWKVVYAHSFSFLLSDVVKNSFSWTPVVHEVKNVVHQVNYWEMQGSKGMKQRIKLYKTPKNINWWIHQKY